MQTIVRLWRVIPFCFEYMIVVVTFSTKSTEKALC